MPQHLPSDLKLYILTGPTAVGKTELALRWAETYGAEIVSADSLLFYRGMNIGTAKPSAAERERVPHHLIDMSEPNEPWNIQRYLAAAVAVVLDIHRRGRRVLVTGGSGFYLKCFFAAVVDQVEVSADVSRQVAELTEQGLETLVEHLRRMDPAADESIDMKNPRRVAKALERCLATGRTLRELREDMHTRPYPFELCPRQLCLLVREREELQDRIVARVDQMLGAGLVEEVRGLLPRGLLENPSAAAAIGYRETIRHLQGELSAEELREEIIRNTRRLVKKQLTWFRYQLPRECRSLSLSEIGEPDVGRLFG